MTASPKEAETGLKSVVISGRIPQESGSWQTTRVLYSISFDLEVKEANGRDRQGVDDRLKGGLLCLVVSVCNPFCLVQRDDYLMSVIYI
jgi:hypothetical protein